MTWVRLDDNMPDHPKVAGLSAVAFRVHVTGICYCARHLTDGFIPKGAVKTFATKRALSELVDARLWRESVAAGYEINDYLDYNPSKENVVTEREARRDRAAKGGRARAAKAQLQAEAKQAASTDNGAAPDPDPAPTTLSGQSSWSRGIDLEVKAKDLNQDIRSQVERVARSIPRGGESIPRLVALARRGATEYELSDALAGYQNAVTKPDNPGAYVCRIIEDHLQKRGVA